MGHRRAIGATAVAAVVFAGLLAMNLALYASSQGRMSMYSRADAEDSLWDRSTVMADVGAGNILLSAQSFLGSSVFDCANASAAVNQGLQGMADFQSSGGLAVSVHARPWSGGSSADNMTALAPFNGPSTEGLELEVSIDEEGSQGGSTLNRTETHVLHLPVNLEDEVRACDAVAQSFQAHVFADSLHNCTSSNVPPLITAAANEAALAASALGYQARVSYAPAGLPCVVEFRVTIAQEAIGPGGTFTVRMQEGGSAVSGLSES